MAIRRGPATAAYGHTQTHTQIETGRQTHLSLFLLDAIALGVAIRLGPATAARGRTQTHTHRERDRHAHTHLSIPSPPPPPSRIIRESVATRLGLGPATAAYGARVGLYTILLLPILYGAWHTNGRSEAGSDIAQKSCNSIAPGLTLKKATYWPQHDIVISSIVWCMVFKRDVGGGGGVRYCPKVVQQYCTRVGNVGGGGE